MPSLLALADRIAHALVFSKIHARLGGRMRIMISGGAPLGREINEFFHAVGLPIYEGYGLTETSPLLAVRTFDRQVLGTVGPPAPGTEIRIVDDAGCEVPERVVGRLVFRGPSVTSGYYRKPEATAAVTLPGGFLDSGDLAYGAEGEIYIAGRRKDLIIKGGRNVVHQEIEEAAAGVEGIRPGCIVAFGVEIAALGTESLVVVAETRATAVSGTSMPAIDS